MKLILASASPRRRELLAHHGIAFEVQPPRVTEWEAADADPAELVRHNAQLKARAVAALRPGEPVLAADTTVALDGHLLNKPADFAEARAMLTRLSGRTHTVYTGVCLCYGPAEETRVVDSRVTFKPLDETLITTYFQFVDPLDKAGAYGIQEGRELIIAGLEGSLSNVMGLPMETIRQMLREHPSLAALVKQ